MVTKHLCYVSVAAATVLCGGCVASHVRTGEVGLLTKRQFQIASAAYHANDSRMNMFAVVAPFEFMDASIVGVTYAPCMDVLCLPYDFFLKLTGDKICIVDDDGIPVEGVEVKLYGHSDAMMISNGLGALHDEVNGRSNKDGLFRTWRHLQNIPSLVEFRRLPHEDFGEASHDVVKGRSYRDSMSVKFLLHCFDFGAKPKCLHISRRGAAC